ncbi:hypothetical protein DFH27DRAFT_554526, partial [Peziza echinospora]
MQQQPPSAQPQQSSPQLVPPQQASSRSQQTPSPAPAHQSSFYATAFSSVISPDFKHEGPDSATKSNYSNAFMTLSEDTARRSPDKSEYCWSLNSNPGITSTRSTKEEGGVGANDEPGKWLVDSGASSHSSPFKHLFLSLTPCSPPLQILTGNGFITAYYRGNIPVILKV